MNIEKPLMNKWAGRANFTDQDAQNLTYSGLPIKGVYTQEDIKDLELPAGPGEYPFTRGIHTGMFRDRLWTRRQYMGFGTGSDVNAWIKDLLSRGQNGLSMALDLPTQMGMDSDDPLGIHEVGRVGVAIDSLADMEAMFEGVPLDEVATSFTVNGTATIIMAMYLVTAEKQGVAPEKLRGTVQNDILKEFVARGTYLFPPGPSLRLVGDIIEYGITNAPKLNTISISGAHMKSAGATLIQSDAFMFANTVAYIEELTKRGYHIDQFGHQLSFLQCVNKDFFEGIARLRAGRRYWAEMARERFGSEQEKTQKYRIHSGGDTDAMTFERPNANVARTALTCMSAVLGGAQSIQLPCWDEAYEIPTGDAIQNALDVQMIIAYESGVTNVVDPLAGSYYIESLTEQSYQAIGEIVEDILSSGGSVKWIEEGRMQAVIAQEAILWEQRLKSGDEIMVGYNYAQDNDSRSDYEALLHPYEEATLERQKESMAKVRAERDQARLDRALLSLRMAAEGDENLMEPIMEAVRAYGTVGEIVKVLHAVFGTFDAPTGI